MPRPKYKTRCRLCKKYVVMTSEYQYCNDCWKRAWKGSDKEKKEDKDKKETKEVKA